MKSADQGKLAKYLVARVSRARLLATGKNITPYTDDDGNPHFEYAIVEVKQSQLGVADDERVPRYTKCVACKKTFDLKANERNLPLLDACTWHHPGKSNNFVPQKTLLIIKQVRKKWQRELDSIGHAARRG